MYYPEFQLRYGLGSGVIFTKLGYIITNHHVIKTADKIEIVLSDGKKTKAIVVGSDPDKI